jgi:hypothetical protein
VLEETEWAGDRIPIVPVWGEEARIGEQAGPQQGGDLRQGRRGSAAHFARSANAERIALAPKAPWLVTPKMVEGFQSQWTNAERQPGGAALQRRSLGDARRRMPTRIAPAPVESGWVQEALQAPTT